MSSQCNSVQSSADVKSLGNGLLTISEDLLQKIIKKEPITEYYFVEEAPFARGKFATVRKARHLETGIEYAAKFIRKRRRGGGVNDTSKEILHEIAVLTACTQSHRVVKLHEVFDARTETVLVLELAAGGELQGALDSDECLNENEAKRAMRQILEGLTHLHEKNIAHLDLKPQNLLLTTTQQPSDIKLCDFGISRVIEPGIEVREILGTPDYVAPEILSYEPISLATDIWSVGVLGYVLLTGYSPFGGNTKQETYLNISQCALTFPKELFQDISNLAIDFIKSALIVDPRCRPSSKKLLEHPWLNQIHLVSQISSALTPQNQKIPNSSDTNSIKLNNSFSNKIHISKNCQCQLSKMTCHCHLSNNVSNVKCQTVKITNREFDRGILC